MESATVTVIVRPTAPAPANALVSLHNRRTRSSRPSCYRTGNLRFRLQSRWSVISAAKGQLPELESSAQAKSIDEILWGQFLVGLGIGVAPTNYKGSLGTWCQIGTCLGIITPLFLGIPSEDDPHRWRTILYFASVPGFVLTLGMQFAAESPRCLCRVRRIVNHMAYWPANDAKQVIRSLWGASEVDREVEEFQSVVTNDGTGVDSKWSELLEQPHLRGDMKYAGINGVLYFSSLTFKVAGITNGASASLLIGITNFAGALGALYLMDREGRKERLIGSYLGMAASMFIIVYAITFQQDEDLSHASSVLASIMYIFTFAIGAGPVTGIIIPELSSSKMCNFVTGVQLLGGSFPQMVCNFLVGLFFLELVEQYGVGSVYASFSSISLLSTVFAYYLTVETDGAVSRRNRDVLESWYQ